MSFAEHTHELDQSFRRTHELLQQLLQGLQARRAAWVSARPSTLATSPELERLTQDIAREESCRDQLIARIRAVLPAPVGADPAALHVNVTRIAAAMPAPAARALRDAADAVQRLAKAVRAEVTLGQRLLRVANEAQDGWADPKRPAPGAGAPGYDRRARTVRAGKTAGAWIDGKA